MLKPMKIKSRKIDMLTGSLWDKVLQFSLPLAVTGILQQLFNAADVAIVGNFVNKEAMAAVGSNSSLIALILNLFLGVSLGANVVIANLTGQGDNERVERAVHSAIVTAVIAGVIGAILGEVVAPPVLRSMGVPDTVYPMAIVYLRVYLAGMPAILLYNFESAIFRSQGDTRTPLICLIISGITNVCLNLFFVIVFHMAAGGVALATILSNLLSAVLLFYFLTKGKPPVRVEISKLRLDLGLLKRMLRIGMPAGIQNMVFSLSNVLIQSAINSLGSDVMAASAAAFNIEIFAFYIVNSFGQAATTFVGQNYGARKLDRCTRVTRVTMLWDMGITAVMSATILFFGARLLALFNPDPAIVEIGVIRLRYILLFEVVSVVMEVASGSMRGYGRSTVPAVITFIGVCGIRIFWVFAVFPRRPAFDTLMICYPISWIVTAIALLIAYFVIKRKVNREI